MSNVTYRQAAAGSTWHKWEYHTPLRPNSERSRYVGPVGLEVTECQTLGPGDWYALDVPTIHSIMVNPRVFTALLLYQYRDAQFMDYTRFYAKQPELPDLGPPMYERMTREQAKQLLNETLEHMR